MNDKYNVINAASKKSDWNANEGEAGFVKNRTHYETVTEENVSTTVTVPSEWESEDYPEYIYYIETVDADFKQSLYDVFIADAENTGAIYHSSDKIRINGTEHDCYWYINVRGSSDGYIEWGVDCFDSADISVDGDYPYQNLYFSIYVESGDSEDYVDMLYNTKYIPIGENNIELTASKIKIKKIDEKFLLLLKNIKDAENGGIIEGKVINNVASGYASHAEGNQTTASGYASHAEGVHTIANHESQHVFGEYNVEDPSTANAIQRGNYVEIVGNGSAGNSRSNGRTLDWSGNEWLAGSITPVGGLILTSPDGSLFTLTVANDGTLSATKQTN